MKYKEIDKLGWLSEPSSDRVVVRATCDALDGYLIADVSITEPLFRIAITENEYGFYIPDGSRLLTCSCIYDMDGKSGWCQIHINRVNMKILKKHLGIKCDDDVPEKTLINIRKFYKNPDAFYRQSSDWKWLLSDIEDDVNFRKAQKRSKKRAVTIKRRMDAVPPIPNGFRQWSMYGMHVHHITLLPFHGNDETEGICSACGERSIWQKTAARIGTRLKCPCCGASGIAKRSDYTKDMCAFKKYEGKADELILLQKTDEGLLERHFVVWEEIYANREKRGIYEKTRNFMVNGRIVTYYAKVDYLNHVFWDDCNIPCMWGRVIRDYPAMVYPKTIDGLIDDTNYRYSGLDILVRAKEKFMPLGYLSRYESLPQLEMLVKLGLTRLALCATASDFISAKKPYESLGITKKQFDRLRAMNGSKTEIGWMQYETSIGSNIDDDDIKWLSGHGIKPENLAFLSGRLSVKKTVNYLKKQKPASGETMGDIVTTWRDYLVMADSKKMKTDLEYILKPTDLRAAHKEMIELCGGEAIAARVGEIGSIYPDIEEILGSIRDKYTYSDGRYAIIVPSLIQDIINEGRVLMHCLDKSNIYFDRIHRRESFIVFLRREDDIDRPFYTLEIEPDGTVRQKRTTGDRQDAEFAEAKHFIIKWQRAIKKRLTSEDLRLAKESNELREQEFIELREKQTKVWHGALAGHLLADVLCEDLMVS